MRGNNIHVPLPNLGCSEEELNALRGVGDEFALKLRYHDESVHRRNVPRAGPAQEMFEWVEDARVASIGSLRMEGVARNWRRRLKRSANRRRSIPSPPRRKPRCPLPSA